MKRMPNINLNMDEIYRIINYQKFNFGAEAIICRTNKKNTLYKIYVSGKEPIRMSENKAKKIKLLHDLSLPYLTNPISTLSMNGELIGYEIPYNPEDEEFTLFRLDRETLLHFLTETRKQLEFLSQHDIVYGDVSPRNILINQNTGQTKFCDVDNIAIGNLPIDIMSPTLKKYHTIRGIDKQTDAYMHSIMTLNSFDLDEDYCSPEEFSYFFENEGIETLQSIRDKISYNGEYIIQYVKKK